ncbi:hypothetical protein EDC02_7096 [Micromonospora sp. Llam0]|nr:hypothetical protein EDC02_7096 [Micromonospora sp. Llam0]
MIQTASSGARISGERVLDDLEHVRDFTTELDYYTTKIHNVLLKTTPSLHPGLAGPLDPY